MIPVPAVSFSLIMDDTPTRTISAMQEVTTIDDTINSMRQNLADVVKNYQILRSDCTTLQFEVKEQSSSISTEVSTALSHFEHEINDQLSSIDSDLSQIRKEVQWLKREKTEIQGDVMLLEAEVRGCEEVVGIDALV